LNFLKHLWVCTRSPEKNLLILYKIRGSRRAIYN